MNTKLIISALALGASTCTLSAQDGNPPCDGQRPPPREDRPNESGAARGEDRPQPEDALAEEQRAQVKTILAKYDAKSLTGEQAKAVHEEFRQAGIRGGPAMNDAVKSSGFDPDKLRDLAPPPDQGKEGGARPPRPEDRQAPSEDRPDPQGPSKQAGPQGERAERPQAGGPGGQGKDRRGQGQYSIEQAVSDRAQLVTSWLRRHADIRI